MYIEYFNIMNNASPGISIFISISFLIIVSLLIYIKVRNKYPLICKLLPIFTVLGIISLIVIHQYNGKEYRALQRVVMENRHLVVEGTVEDFTPEGETGLIPESFKVKNVEFSYFTNSETAAFHSTSNSGGPIKDGLKVRIFHSNNKILGLWIKEE